MNTKLSILLVGSLSLILCAASPTWAQQQGAAVSVDVLPGEVLLENGKGAQLLNFDFRIRNAGPTELTLFAIHLSVHDARGHLQLVKFLDGNGLPASGTERGDASLEILHGTKVAPEGTLFVFNPFFSFDLAIDLAELRYRFDFADPAGMLRRIFVTVRPVVYEPKTDLILPMQGLLLVHDGHDFYSHHRRLSLSHPLAHRFSIRTNSSRYAVDLCVVDEQGRLFKGTGNRHEEWFGWAVPVLAPGKGIVREIQNDVVDNPVRNGVAIAPSPFDYKNISDFMGNYVVIDHGNGEFSHFGHLKQGSVKVRAGDEVEAGQPVAELGLSGSTGHVHLHYQLQTGIDAGTAEGLPSYFSRYRRRLGTRSVDIDRGAIDTGDLVLGLPD